MTRRPLNENQQKILHILQTENKAMSAYDLLHKAKPLGFHAPMQIYRILEKLMAHGLVLRLDTMNMYFAYQLNNQEYYLFTICLKCQKVNAVEVPQLKKIIQKPIMNQNFINKNQYLEVIGQCDHC